MIRLQDVSLVDACRYKVGGKGLGIRARVVLICMVSLTCYSFVYYFWLLSSVFSPFAISLLGVLLYFSLLFGFVP